MVKTIRLKTNTSNYLIRIGNLSFKKIINDLKKQQTYKYILIDTEVYKNFRSYFNKLKGKNVTLIKINSSEKIKSIKKNEILKYIEEIKLDQKFLTN